MSNDSAVERCALALRNAKSDTEKLAALLICTRLVRADECDVDQRKRLFSAIGFDFVDRLLAARESDIPAGCPPNVFRDLALNIYATFATVPDIFEHSSSSLMVDKVPVFLKLLSTYDARTSEEEISARNDALRCLFALVSNPKTCLSLVDQDGMEKLCLIFAKDEVADEFREQVFALISSCINQLGAECWRKNPPIFNTLMNVLSSRMLKAKTQQKFTMCDVITRVLVSFPPQIRETCASEKWYLDFHEELLGILCFKLGQAQREPLLKLCSAITEKLGVSWALNNVNNNVNYENSCVEKSQRLFFLLVQLSCIEVRMSLEEENLDDVMKNYELAAACYVILEHAVKFLIEDDGQTVKQVAQLQLYDALTAAFGAILFFFSLADKRWNFEDEERTPSEFEWQFIVASFRVFGAWLAEETLALRDEIYQVLPFLFKVCQHQRGSEKLGDKCLHFLLPGLCHLVAEDPPRSIMLKENFPSVLNEFNQRSWSVFKEEVKEEILSDEMDLDIDSKRQVFDSEADLISGTNILLQIIVLEGEKVREDPSFMKILRFMFVALPAVDKKTLYLLLRGNLTVLGLLLLRHHAQQVSSTNEVTIYRYLSASIRFLWDAFNVEDSSDGASLVVNRMYRAIWDQVREMWYLGMQALSELLTPMPWVGQFVVESGWAEEIISMLSKAKKSGVEDSVKVAYEDFLCCLVKTCSGAAGNLNQCGASNVCGVHKMKTLAKLLRRATTVT